MRRVLATLLSFMLANVSLLEAASKPSAAKFYFQGDEYSYEPFSPEQLDNLLAPIALYPDPLLSQVLVAATFVDDVDEAARWVRANGPNGIDNQPWDVSVKAVAHYPSVIYMMADKIDWTTTLGQAYVNQSTDVMMSVQRLRRMAYNVGNLVSSPQQRILVEADYISIVPYDPMYIYVPVYDPWICYYRRPYWGVAISFGVGFLIGAWLNRDCDWHHHSIYYHGWHGPWWVERSRPHVHITNIYVNNRYENVVINRNVFQRNVNVNNVNRFRYIHREVNYKNIEANNARVNRMNHVRPPQQPGRPPVNNKIINRNIDTTNPRLDRYRGREDAPGQARPAQPQPRPQPQAQPQPQPRPQPQAQPQPQPQAQPRVQPPRTPPPVRPTPPAPVPRTAPAPAPRPAPHVFGRSEGNFDPRASSQRGQSSRQQVNQPRPAPRPAPAPRAQSNAPRAQSKPAPSPRGGERRKP